MTKYPMTLRGAEQLQTELKMLKTEKRPRIVKDIADATLSYLFQFKYLKT